VFVGGTSYSLVQPHCRMYRLATVHRWTDDITIPVADRTACTALRSANKNTVATF